MNIKQFQKLSKRTMPFEGKPKTQNQFEQLLTNYAMGLVGEAIEMYQELDRSQSYEKKYELMYYRSEITLEQYNHYKKSTTNQLNESLSKVIKEAGDVMHYAVGLLTCLGETINTKQLKEEGKTGTLYAAGEVSEIVKKHIFHKHELDKENLIAVIYGIIADLYATLGEFMPSIFETNINKLKLRYPDKFNTADSIKRVDVHK